MPEATRQRVLVVTRNLPPLVGGMERLNLHLVCALAEDREMAVVGPHGCRASLPLPPRHVAEVPTRPLPLFLAKATALALLMAHRFRPDVVMAGSGLTAPLAWLAARLCGARLVVYVHGLDLVVQSLPYRLGWLPAIRRADLVIANSGNTRCLALARGVAAERVAVLHPGTDLPAPDAAARGRFRAAHCLGVAPLLLSVGRLTPRKGLAGFVEHALPAILREIPDAKLVVIGADATDAARPRHDSERARIVEAARRASLAHAIVFLPPCDDVTLADAYQAADVHVFPVRDLPGDVEGFGMVAVEAAAHGLPTVAFDVGGVADAVLPGKTGVLVTAGDYTGFINAVVAKIRARGALGDTCRQAAAGFSWDRFGDRLRELLRWESRHG